MTEERRPDGRFVARADGHIDLRVAIFTQTRPLHVVLRTSDANSGPDDTTEPNPAP